MRTSSLVLVVLALTAQPAAAQQSKEAVALLDKAIQAHGGTEALTKSKSQAWKGKGTMTAGGMKFEYVADYTFAAPDKLRFDLQAEFGGMKVMLTAGTDGKTAWEQMGDQVRKMEKDKQAEFHHTVYQMNVTSLLPLRDKAFNLAYLGESKLGDMTVLGIKVSQTGQRDISIYFDKKTNLLAKASTRVVDEFTMKDAQQDTLLTEYRDLDGKKVFDKMTILRDGKDFIVETFSNQRVLDKVDAKLFAVPPGVK